MQARADRSFAAPAGREMSRLGDQRDGQRGDGYDSQSCLAEAAGGNATSRRKQPHPLARDGRPQAHPARGAGIGRHVGGVADGDADAHHKGSVGAQGIGDQRGQAPCSSAGERRVGHSSVRDERCERNHWRPQHRCGGTEDHAPPLEDAAPVDTGAELIDIGQPRAAQGPRREPGALERPCLERLCRGKRKRDAKKLVGCVAHTNEANRTTGRPRAPAGRWGTDPGAGRGSGPGQRQ